MNLDTARLSGLIRPAVWGMGAVCWFGVSAAYSSNPGTVLLGTLFGAALSVKFFVELRRYLKNRRKAS